MSTLVRLKDNVLVEVAAPADPSEPVSSSGLKKLEAAFDAVAGALGDITSKLISSVRTTMDVQGAKEASIEFGVGITAEGDIFVSRVSTEATLKVTMSFAAK